MKKYVRLMRIDHWIKQLFVIPGVLAACVLADSIPPIPELCVKSFIGLLSLSMVASSNYVLNEWLDAKSDKFHPTKKNRTAVTNRLNPALVYLLYFGLFGLGMLFSVPLSFYFRISVILLWLMGIIYNVKPIRTKDIPYVDVYTESMNNAIRLLAGWFIVIGSYYPPISIVLGYWLAGAFLMSMKRFAEYRMINNSETAGRYRKSFRVYTSRQLLILSFFNAMLSVLFIGIFLIKYRIELVVFMPFLIGLFCYYTYIAFNDDSAAQSPEKLYKDKKLLLFIVLLAAVFTVTMLVDIPVLEKLLSDILIPIE